MLVIGNRQKELNNYFLNIATTAIIVVAKADTIWAIAEIR